MNNDITRIVAIEHKGEKIQLEIHVHLSQEEIERVVTPAVLKSLSRQLRMQTGAHYTPDPTMPQGTVKPVGRGEYTFGTAAHMIGTCWACQQPGEYMAWYGSHLIHASEECKALAEQKPEQREHRG